MNMGEGDLKCIGKTMLKWNFHIFLLHSIKYVGYQKRD